MATGRDTEYDYEPDVSDTRDLVPAGGGAGNGVGLLTQPRQHLAPSMLAEQQRAKSEIEAALTIAAARPRDEKEALDKILVSCQRPGLAAKSQYEYSRGGTAISGPTIDLMEMIAAKWGNIEFGFRELARLPGAGGQPGESIVEAFAWDLESNTRRKVQFTVAHAMKSGSKLKVLADPRDIYEYVANMAQRRVRTCLENLIPRDIVETACEECDRTMKANVGDIKDATAKMLKAFGDIGVVREQIEARIQRHMDSVTPGQLIGLRKIYASLRDGMSKPEDWFPVPEQEQPKSAMDTAKEALKKKAAAKKSTAAKAPEEPVQPAEEPPFNPPTAEEIEAAEKAESSDVETAQAAVDAARAARDRLQWYDEQFALLEGVNQCIALYKQAQTDPLVKDKIMEVYKMHESTKAKIRGEK